jgi:hypothetical protein
MPVRRPGIPIGGVVMLGSTQAAPMYEDIHDMKHTAKAIPPMRFDLIFICSIRLFKVRFFVGTTDAAGRDPCVALAN